MPFVSTAKTRCSASSKSNEAIGASTPKRNGQPNGSTQPDQSEAARTAAEHVAAELRARSDAEGKAMAVMVERVRAAENETVRLQQSLRGILMSVDLVVTSQDRYNERCQIPGTVEFTAHRDGRVLHDSL